MDKLTAIKIKYDDGTYSDEIPISVLSENVEWDSAHTLVDVLGSIDVDVTGTIQDQISQLFNEKVDYTQLNNYVVSQLTSDVTTWLNDNVDPVGSAVIVDKSLSVEGAAADAAQVGKIKGVSERIIESDDYVFAVSDDNNKAAFLIDAKGYSHLKQKNFANKNNGFGSTDEENNYINEFNNDGLFDFCVCDKNGKVLFYVDNGILKVNSIQSNNFKSLENNFNLLNINYNNFKNNNYQENENFDAEINMFICYGQSWAEGYDARAITLSQKYDNIMLNTGIKNNPLNDMNQTATSFIPMVEENGTSSGPESQIVGETPVSAQSNIIKQLIEDENGYSYTDFPYQILGTSPGYGSRSLMQLKKGTDYYNRLIAQVQMAYNIATNLNKKLVVQAFSWAQGDLGTGATGTYAENLEQLRLDIDTDVKNITGQTQTVKCITWQSFLYTANAARDFYNRFVGASELYPNIICSGASYHLDNVASGNLHFTSESQDWLGAYFGIAYKRTIIDQNKFIPLKPISATFSNNILLITFNVPQKPLVFDTTRVTYANNYGFNLYDNNNNEKTINSIEIVSPDTIKIICDSQINATDYLTYAQNAGSTWGRNDGNRGNLRDSQGDYINYISGIGTKLPMHNWCVVFNKTISELEV